MERRFDDANKALDRALKLAPDSFNLWSIKAQMEISEKGTFEIAERAVQVLSTRPLNEETKMHFASAIAQTRLTQRRYAEALQLAESFKDETLGNDLEGLAGKYGCIGIAKKMLGDEAGSRAALLKAKGFTEQMVAMGPNHPKGHERVAQAMAWLGEKDAAIAEAKRATELLPESVDAFDGPVCTQTLAEVYALVGEYDKAIEILDGLLTRPSQVTVATVRVNPVWDPVRQDPRFIAMMKKHGG
jgi:serine/threonine-protein kinase